MTSPIHPSAQAAPGHLPVMLGEVLSAIRAGEGELVVDATFGGGGYTQALLASARCQVIGIDRDPEAVGRARRMAEADNRLIPVEGCFGDMDRLVAEAGHEKADAVVMDIGVSSFQIDTPGRGFSFQKEGPLDMRMGDAGPSAAVVVNYMEEKALADLVFRLGEERNARRIARAIVQRRATAPFLTTTDLAGVVEAAVGGRRGARVHPATQTFQAIRMYVNDELGELSRGLSAAERLLRPGGRLVIVAFHSLEDRLVKQWLRLRSGGALSGSRHLPPLPAGHPPSFARQGQLFLMPSEKEVETNPRARSARLRSAIRTESEPGPLVSLHDPGLPPLSHLERIS